MSTRADERDVLTRPYEALPATTGTSWGAILAGAVAAASLSLILIILGAGLGFASTSPWGSEGIDAGTFGITAALWIIFTQLVAAAVGGYLAGRLRNRWTSLHTDEVYFRDTAHGFLAWGVATLVVAVVASSVVTSVARTGVQAGGSIAGAAVGAAATTGAAVAAGSASSPSTSGEGSGSQLLPYSISALFRAPAGADGNLGESDPTAMKGEAAEIFTRSLQDGKLEDADADYLARVIAQRTGLPPEEARKRVEAGFDDVRTRLAQAKDKALATADEARRKSAKASIWMFAALLIGAFIASLAGTYGGRRRDLYA